MSVKVTQSLKEQIHAAALQGVTTGLCTMGTTGILTATTTSRVPLGVKRKEIIDQAHALAEAYIVKLQAAYDKDVNDTKPEGD